jgi:hypothetical protein
MQKSHPSRDNQRFFVTDSHAKGLSRVKKHSIALEMERKDSKAESLRSIRVLRFKRRNLDHD